MGKKNRKKNQVSSSVETVVQNQAEDAPISEKDLIVKNGLSEAIFGTGNMGQGAQISQVDTMFKSNRWYLVSNMRQLLSESYVEMGIVQTIVDVPVDDGFRGGVKIKSKQLDDDDVTKLTRLMDKEGDIDTIAQAHKWNRLFGGAGVLIMTNQNPKLPLDISKIKKGSNVEFRALDMWELYWSHQNTDDYSAAIDGSEDQSEFFDYYGQQVHKSRVLKLKGLVAPSFVRPRLRGWGFSIIESMIRSMNQYLKATDLTFEVLDEFKVDVFKIKGLAQTLLSPGGDQRVRNRIEIANRQKNYQHAITMDGEDDYVQKQLSFSGLAEAMEGIRMQLASDLRMPLTKLFGVSSAGFNSGEDDIENYNSMVESTVRNKAKYELVKMIEIRCQQLFGMIPDDIEVEFLALRMMSSEQEQNVKDSKYSRLLQARQAGEISSSQFKEACNQDDLLPIKLDVDDTLYPTPMTKADGADLGGSSSEASSGAPPTPTAKNSSGIDAHVSVVGIVCPGGKILTGRRKDNGLWTFPCGHIEGQEAPIEAAMRETLEESGIELSEKDTKPAKAEVVRDEKNDRNVMVHAFTASIPEKIMPKTIMDPDQEIEVWRWVPLSPETHELKPENRHAKNDLILKHFFGGK